MKRELPEFHRPIEVARVSSRGSTEILVADAAERGAVARRLGTPAVHALRASFRAEPWKGRGLRVEGAVTAELERTCVVTLENFRERVSPRVERYYLPPSDIEEIEEEAGADPIRDGKIDLGELALETLVLDLDPYPRKPGAVFAAPADEGGETSSPFAVLRAGRSSS